MAWRDAALPVRLTNRRLAVALSVILLTLGVASSSGNAEPPADGLPKGKGASGKPTPADGPAKAKAPPPAKAPAQPAAAVKPGLSVNDPRAFQGYTLFGPFDSTTTYLIDMQGRVVHTWQSDCAPALCPYLLENGHLLRAGSIGPDSRVFGPGPGVGGKIQEFTWDGTLVWDYRFYNARQLPHHDLTRMPNGNVLLVVSDRKTNEEALAAGRRPELVGDSHSIPDSIIEIRPTGKTTGEVVWEWHVWDHLIQDFDKAKANYGDVARHPELIHANYGEGEQAQKPAGQSPAKPPSKGNAAAAKPGPDKAKPKGTAAATPAAPRRGNPDWTHFNAVAYNADLDQIVVSVYSFNEFWVIDHGTTAAEAAGHAGGRYGKGGDLLYRWGNPRAYRAGGKEDQTLFHQHNVHWIPKGLPGEGHLLLFNNGSGRPGENYSTVEELVLPADPKGRYARYTDGAFVAPQVVWSYTAPKKSDFFSSFISGAHRLPNGNTFICSGANGTLFEVTPSKDVVWKYVNPVKRVPGGPDPRPKHGTVLSPVAGEFLGVSAGQRKELVAVQKTVDTQLGQLLTADQKKKLAAQSRASSTKPGEILSLSEQVRLELTAEQRKKLAALQKDVDEQLDKVLTAAQKKQIKQVFTPGGPPPSPTQIGGMLPQLKSMFGGQPPAEAGRIFTRGQQDDLKLTPEQRDALAEMQQDVDRKLETLLTPEQQARLRQMRPGAGGPGSPAGGPPMFRAYRYGREFPGLAGKNLKPGKTIEELQQTPQKKEVAKDR